MGSLDTLIKNKASNRAPPAHEEPPEDRLGSLRERSVPQQLKIKLKLI